MIMQDRINSPTYIQKLKDEKVKQQEELNKDNFNQKDNNL